MASCFCLVLLLALLGYREGSSLVRSSSPSRSSDSINLSRRFSSRQLLAHHEVPSRLKLNTAWEMLVPENYSETIPPSYSYYEKENKQGPPFILLTIKPFFVTQISMKQMDYAVDVSAEIRWADHRVINNSFPDELDAIPVPGPIQEQLWIPEITYRNCKGSNPNVVNMDTLRFRAHLKEFFASKRQTISFSCVYSLKRYPFDVQFCSMRMKFVHLGLHDISLITTPLVQEDIDAINVPPEFQLTSLTIATTVVSSTLQFVEYNLEFHRIYAQHILMVFIPSTLIIVLSWIAFLLPVDTPAPRVALGLTTLLTLVTQMNAAQKDLPAVAEMKALDVWMFTCIFMVFAALVELSLSYFCFLVRKANSQKNKVVDLSKLVPKYVSTVESGYYKPKKKQPSARNKRGKLKVKMKSVFSFLCPYDPNVIDTTARIIFPSVFLIFNIAFWCRYLT